jgi:hypothetical protein
MRIKAYQQRKHDRKVGRIGNGIYLDGEYREHNIEVENMSDGHLPSFHEEFFS